MNNDSFLKQLDQHWIALHGLFGESSQWDFLQNVFQLHAIDLYPLLVLPKEKLLLELLKKCPHKSNIVGYSMGGRIAMELFLQAPHKFNRLIILASHPGLVSADDIHQRRLWEESLIFKLQNDPEQFIHDWNQLDIFKNDKQIKLPQRPSFELTAGISNWGLSKQENLLPKLKPFKDKITWIIGSEDDKYQQLWQSHCANLNSNHLSSIQMSEFNLITIPNAGHRLLQHPDKIKKVLMNIASNQVSQLN